MKRHREALYRECNRTQVIATWFGAILNGALVLGCVVWLTVNAAASPAWPILLALVFVGLFFGDFFTGVIHWMTDTYFDETGLTRMVSIAREHHLYPQHILGYGFRDYVGYTSWPAVLLFAPLLGWLLLGARPSAPVYGAVWVICLVCVISFFGTHFHRFGHRFSPNAVGRFLQRTHLLITPQYHGLHHGGSHQTHYCVVNGWANVVCDAIGFWHAVERVIQRLTGAVPRRNDAEWVARFREDRSFMTDPVPSLRRLRRQDSVPSHG